MKLEKSLNTFEVFSIGAGTMISSGLFILPAIAFQEAGSSVIIAYFAAGLLMLPALFSQMELVSAIPKSGGTYFFLERILGTPIGMLAGLANWFSIALKSSFALIGIGVFTTLIAPSLPQTILTLISVAACLIFGFLNIMSIKSSSRVQVILVIFLLLVLLNVLLITYRKADFSLISQSWDFQLPVFIQTTAMVFISYGGITKIASVSEEVQNPKKTIIRGTFLAFFVVQVFYILIISLVIAVLPENELSSSLTPISDAAVAAAANSNFSLFQLGITAVAGAAAFITTANAGIMSASRMPMAMSRDRLLPDFFSRISQKRKTPVISIILTTAFMIIAIIALDLKDLAKVASFFMILLFLLVNLSVIVIRFSKIENYRPSFKSPLFPVFQIIGIVCYVFLMSLSGRLPLIIGGGFLLVSLLIYLIYARKRVERKSAFVKMIGRIAKPDFEPQGTLPSTSLEDELLDILIEREDIEEDRFDTLIRNAPVFDFDKTISRKHLFSRISETIAEDWGSDAGTIAFKLETREEESSTLIYPGVAVPHALPHVILPGEHRFQIILVRNKYGIKWNEEGDVIYTAFTLVGTKDERNFHLKCLMWIAQLLQDPEFHKQWHKAKTPTELRTVVLLTKRRRK